MGREKSIVRILLGFLVIVILSGCNEQSKPPRLTLNQFADQYVKPYLDAGEGEAGYDALEKAARELEGREYEVIGPLSWRRPFYINPESKYKNNKDLVYGDFVIDSAKIEYHLDWLELHFDKDTQPDIKPSLADYGLDKPANYEYMLWLPHEYILLQNNDTLRNLDTVVVRGKIQIDWKRGMRKPSNPRESISLKDCVLIELLPPCE